MQDPALSDLKENIRLKRDMMTAGGRKAKARKRKSANAEEEMDKRRKRGSAAALQPLGGGLPADGGTKRRERRSKKSTQCLSRRRMTQNQFLWMIRGRSEKATLRCTIDALRWSGSS